MHDKLLSPARHEQTDVSGFFIWMGAALILVLVLVLAGVVVLIFPDSLPDRFLRMPLPEYAAPRLQVSTREDMEKFYAEEMRRLNSAGWIDKSSGKAHVPIDVAMRLVASRGISDWPSPARRPP